MGIHLDALATARLSDFRSNLRDGVLYSPETLEYLGIPLTEARALSRLVLSDQNQRYGLLFDPSGRPLMSCRGIHSAEAFAAISVNVLHAPANGLPIAVTTKALHLQIGTLCGLTARSITAPIAGLGSVPK